MKEVVVEKGKVYEIEYKCLYELRHHVVDMLVVGYEIIKTERVSKIGFKVTYRLTKK